MVHYVDVAPTLIEAAGGAPVEGLDGRSFLRVLQGKTDRHNGVTYGVHTQKGAIGSPESGYPIRSIRAGRYKYIMNLNHAVTFNSALIKRDTEQYWSSWVEKANSDPHAKKLVQRYLHRPSEEFYDLEQDPHELNNLAADPRHRSRMNAMQGQLQAWMESQGDRGIETELSYQRKGKKKKR